LAAFWAEVLGYEIEPPPVGYDSWEDVLKERGAPEEMFGSVATLIDPEGAVGPITFQRVPEPKAGKNRLHLDITCGGGPGVSPDARRDLIDAEMRRLIALGATELHGALHDGDYYVTMLDPEGNEFCLQ
jgi:hypothetical protein